MYVVCHTTTRSTQDKRHWLQLNWIKLADYIWHRYSFRVVLSGDESYNQTIADLSDSNPVVWSGTLVQLRDLFRNSELIISVNTFPMHLAIALKKPLIAIIGATHPSIIIPENVPHCYSKYAKDIPFECVRQKVEEVLR